MKATGIVRRIDQLGRITLPKELRKTIGLPEGTPLEILVDGDSIVFHKYANRCVLCGDDDADHLLRLSGKFICRRCAERAGDAAQIDL